MLEISLPDENTQSTQGRNQDGRRKGVRSKVCDFTKSHCEPVSIWVRNVKSDDWFPYVSIYHPTTRDSSNMRILRPQIHVVRRRASSPVFRRISDSAPTMIALDRIAAVFVSRIWDRSVRCSWRIGTPTFLVITKLVPMAMVDTMAKISPTYL